MTSSLSSHSTSASVSELSRLVTHTAVSSPKCNSEKRPLSNSVAFQTLFKWHRYCGILKIHIVRKINTGIRYEPVYRPALHQGSFIIYTYFTCDRKETKCLSESYFCDFVALMDAWLLRQGFCSRSRIEQTSWSSNNSWRWSSTRSGPSLRNSICLKKVIYGLQYLLMDK